jgi:hypothetical protein
MHTCTPWTVVCRSWLMSLIMTFMFEPAKLQMNWARASGSSIFRSAEAVTGRAAVLVMTRIRSYSSIVFLLPTGYFRATGDAARSSASTPT